jgi:hypothetical protein
MRRLPAIPRGPRYLQSLRKRAVRQTGPGLPPAGFLSSTNSVLEWYIYWALAKILRVPPDVRQPPYIGWPGVWSYQAPYEGGRVTGGQVIDFIVEPYGTTREGIAMRVQTERYHFYTPATKQALDRLQQFRLSRLYRVVDLPDTMFAGDESGQAAILLVKQALSGFPSNPLRTGTLVRATRLD